MSRIHPSSSENKSRLYHVDVDEHEAILDPVASPRHTTFTVWKRSSMSFQGTDGFTVYDRRGRLAFRVDNYSRNSHIRRRWSCSVGGNGGTNSGGGAVVLMDGSGKPLITLKPQIFSMQNQWNGCIYREEDDGSTKSEMRRIFTMRRPSSSVLALGRTQKQQAPCEAEVFFTGTENETETGGGSSKQSGQPDYRIEGSFWNRNCKIRSTASGKVVAKITRKRTAAAAKNTGNLSNNSSINSTITLSEEVFSLVVQPGFDPQLIMAFVVILDRICFKPFFPHLMCS